MPTARVLDIFLGRVGMRKPWRSTGSAASPPKASRPDSMRRKRKRLNIDSNIDLGHSQARGVYSPSRRSRRAGTPCLPRLVAAHLPIARKLLPRSPRLAGTGCQPYATFHQPTKIIEADFGSNPSGNRVAASYFASAKVCASTLAPRKSAPRKSASSSCAPSEVAESAPRPKFALRRHAFRQFAPVRTALAGRHLQNWRPQE